MINKEIAKLNKEIAKLYKERLKINEQLDELGCRKDEIVTNHYKPGDWVILKTIPETFYRLVDITVNDDTKEYFPILENLKECGTKLHHIKPWKPKDKEVVIAYDDDRTSPHIVVYDAINDCGFTSKGKRDGWEYEHYIPYTSEIPPCIPIYTLED